MALAAGAEAVVGLRFDCSEITQSLSEVAAYGTAVKLVPEADNTADAGRRAEQHSPRAMINQWAMRTSSGAGRRARGRRTNRGSNPLARPVSNRRNGAHDCSRQTW